MPIFHLKPVLATLDQPAWANSRLREPCWVHAVDEAEARGMASARFQDAGSTVPGHASPPSPWRDPLLVQALPADDAPEAHNLPYGTIVGGLQA